MAYSTLADLQELVSDQVLISLTDDADAGTIDAAAVDRAIADSDAVIDGYVRTRYPVPLSPVPQLIRNISVTLTRYRLFSRRGFDETSADKAVVRDNDNAIAMLKSIAKGELTLGVTSPAPDTSTAISGPARVMSRDELEVW